MRIDYSGIEAPAASRNSKNLRLHFVHFGVKIDQSAGTADWKLAVKERERVKREIEEGRFQKRNDKTFGEAVATYRAMGGKERTEILEPVLAELIDTPVTLIDQEKVNDVARRLLPHASPATRNRQVYTPISSVLKVGAGIRLGLSRPKGSNGKQRSFWLQTPEQAERVFIEADKLGFKFGLLIRYLTYTGLRLGEALRATWFNIDFEGGTAFVGKTKNGEPRAVYLPDHLLAGLRQLKATQPGERLFWHKSGHLYKKLGQLRAALMTTDPEYRQLVFHTFRHTWGSWMRKYAGMDTRGLVGTGAWLSEAAARRYEHVVASAEARKALLLPVVLPLLPAPK